MGLYAFEVGIIADICQKLPLPFHVLSLGHPDILATPKELRPILGITLPRDGRGVLESRKYAPHPEIVGNAHILFDALGGTLDCIDTREVYNIDVVADLNEPVCIGEFDLVIDPGTTEHCFNVGQAMKNVANAVKKGGYVYHMVPLCHWNHGFWNFSPCAFVDFYEHNGFQVERIEAEYNGNFMPVDTFNKFAIKNHGRKLNLMCIAKKVKDVPVAFPMQGKYVKKMRHQLCA